MGRPAARRSAVGRSDTATGLVPVHPTHYERLGVAADASGAQIDAAWERLQHRHALPSLLTPSLALPGTPTGAELEGAALRLAHAVLRDEARRAVYDAWLRREAVAQKARARRWWQRPGPLLGIVLGLLAVAGAAWWWLQAAGAD